MSDDIDWLSGDTAPGNSRPPRSGTTRAAKAPRRDLIPAADAWLVFRATTAAGDPDGPVDHVEDLRVVRGRDLNAEARKGEPRDWTHDVPLLCAWATAEDAARLGCRADPSKDPEAAWRVFCSRWRVGPEAYEAIACVQGLEWAADMGRWARRETAA